MFAPQPKPSEFESLSLSLARQSEASQLRPKRQQRNRTTQVTCFRFCLRPFVCGWARFSQSLSSQRSSTWKRILALEAEPNLEAQSRHFCPAATCCAPVAPVALVVALISRAVAKRSQQSERASAHAEQARVTTQAQPHRLNDAALSRACQKAGLPSSSLSYCFTGNKCLFSSFCC